MTSPSLKSVDPGNIHLDVHQYGGTQTAAVTAQTFSEPAQLDGLTLHAGDSAATLTGTSLDQVRQLSLSNLDFHPLGDPTLVPSQTGSNQHTQRLTLSLPESAQPPSVHPGDHLVAHLSLRDGRILSLPVVVDPARPSVTLLNRGISQPPSSPIHLANPDDIPVTQKLTFSLHSASPFPRDGKIEIANADESLHTSLTVSSGLVLQNTHTVLGTFDPLKAFGTSAFGPVRLRAVAPDGTAGDWISLATLVRLPTLQDIHCPSDPAALCTLNGSDLYLVDSVAPDSGFASPVEVPEGFVGNTLSVPRPPKSGFYLKLRDEPESANIVNMPIQLQRTSPPPQPAAVTPPPAPAPAAPEPAPAVAAPNPVPANPPANPQPDHQTR